MQRKRPFQLPPVALGLCVLPLVGLPIIAYEAYANARGVLPSGVIEKLCFMVGGLFAAIVFELADRFGYLRHERTHKSLFRERNEKLETVRDTSVRNALRAAVVVAVPTGAAKLIEGAVTEHLTDVVVDAAGAVVSDVIVK